MHGSYRRLLLPFNILFLVINIMLILYMYYEKEKRYHVPIPQAKEKPVHPSVTPEQYTIKEFTQVNKTDGLSQSQIDQHKQLYAGYVKKRNEIEKALQKVDLLTAASRTYSLYRSLKIGETYAWNGSLLHELYFSNLGTPGQSIGPKFKALIEKSFGSIDAFKSDFMAAGGCSRGWVVTAWGMDDQRIHNFVCDEHNQHMPVLVMPLLILDVYEHAYMIDFGIAREPYLEVFWRNIDWQEVENRIDTWVTPFASKT